MRIAGGFKVDPADIRAVGETAEIFLARGAGHAVNSEIRGRRIGILSAIRRHAGSHFDPTSVSGIDKPGTKVIANHDTIRITWPPVGKANVRTPSISVRRINRSLGEDKARRYCTHSQGEKEDLFHMMGGRFVRGGAMTLRLFAIQLAFIG